MSLGGKLKKNKNKTLAGQRCDAVWRRCFALGMRFDWQGSLRDRFGPDLVSAALRVRHATVPATAAGHRLRRGQQLAVLRELLRGQPVARLQPLQQAHQGRECSFLLGRFPPWSLSALFLALSICRESAPYYYFLRFFKTLLHLKVDADHPRMTRTDFSYGVWLFCYFFSFALFNGIEMGDIVIFIFRRFIPGELIWICRCSFVNYA